MNSFNAIPAHIKAGAAIGALGGLTITAFLFFNVTWYHDMIVWSWTNPWMWLICGPIGFAVGYFTDGD